MKAWINWIRKKKCCYITGPDQVWWCLNFCQLQFQRHTFSHVHRCEKWADVMLLLINAVLSESKSVSNTQTIGVWCSVVFFCVCFSLCDKWKSLRVGHSVNWDSAVLWLWCDWKSKWQTQRAFYIYIYIESADSRCFLKRACAKFAFCFSAFQTSTQLHGQTQHFYFSDGYSE